MTSALEKSLPNISEDTLSIDQTSPKSFPEKAIKTLEGFGMKRFVCQILCLSGEVNMRDEKVLGIISVLPLLGGTRSTHHIHL